MVIFLAILIFYLGASLSSFSNLLAMRMIDNQKIDGFSHCDSCGAKLRFVDVMPIFGYLINLGKCHFCENKINPKHLIIELIGGIIYMISYLIIRDITLDLAIAFIMIFVLMTESLTDIYKRIVYDRIWLIGLGIIIILRLSQGEILPYLLSSAILFSLMFILALFGKIIFKKEAFGGGDIKIYLFIGFCITYDLGLLSLFIASIFGLTYALVKRLNFSKELPFIPMISSAVLFCYFYGKDLLDWYLNLF